MKKIQGKSTLVLLHLEIVLVFGKILSHGDKFVPDVVPSVQHLIGSRACRTWKLILRLGLTVKTHSGCRQQSEHNRRERASLQRLLHRKFSFVLSARSFP